MCSHDNVIKWKHFPRYWPFVRGIHQSPVNSPHKGQWRGALMFSLICAWTNGWVNNRDTGDLRRYRAHYDVIAMHVVNVGKRRQYGAGARWLTSTCTDIPCSYRSYRGMGKWFKIIHVNIRVLMAKMVSYVFQQYLVGVFCFYHLIRGFHHVESHQTRNDMMQLLVIIFYMIWCRNGFDWHLETYSIYEYLCADESRTRVPRQGEALFKIAEIWAWISNHVFVGYNYSPVS